ncbi:Phytochrome-like protein cph2 [Planktothrix tepida]|uniref:Response regulator receiver modulated diguanylate cyclase n=1 Tax=Planktothrix tepida PCC 9214 TaxID=671072 RepID=A0A1J1LQP0_9CYAN|nr:PleD family two-component system response regulator [Planktothrix tepida]CAD5955159.1 Phytochrome-like protein cph2 [Planktothrix tepida]CUR34188.1 Response regulator receiver modulated diguanylate cyclase [Planktothrix tepida PCC 9214]
MNPDETFSTQGNLLIIDDEPDNIRVLSALLTQQGYYVRKALNADMAMIAITALKPDLILLDIRMPQVTGYELCNQLKSSPDTYEIPIIFISALNQVEDIIKAFSVGGVDYITKPFKVDEVLARVKNQLTICLLKQQLIAQNQKLLQQNNQLQNEIKTRKKAEENLQTVNRQLQNLASCDSLTSLANRRHFDEYFDQVWKQMIEEQQPLALLVCDLDYFKNYNDHYGHPAGDICLKLVAQALDRSINNSTDLVARYGGEEFAIILPNTDLQGALKVAKTIHQEVQRLKINHEYSRVSSIVTVSIGISYGIPQPNTSPEELLEIADQALYEAKQKGRNQYCVKV